MSNHVTEWLNAYLDGELKGRQLHQVEEHLASCEACQTELDTLQGLSSLLQEVHAPTLVSHERFVSQVNLRLPERRAKETKDSSIGFGWWLIPVGLLAAWIFISTTTIVSDMVTVANNFGLLDQTTASFVSSPANTNEWTATLGQVGVLNGKGLQWAERSESYTRDVLPQFVWQGAIAFLYLAWIAISWARHTRQVNGQLLEG